MPPSPRPLAVGARAAFSAGPTPGASSRARAAFLVALAVLVVGMSLKYAAKVSKPGDTGQQTRSAFLRWRAMVHELFAGANVYVGVYEYPNPPIMAVVLRPFVGLPPVAGALAWFYAKVLMATLAVVWVFRLLAAGPASTQYSVLSTQYSPPDAAKAVAVLLALPPLLGDLSHNNVNIFILFLVAGCLEAYRRGWDRSAGLVLALAVACKVTPLLFVAYFAWKRAWRVLAGCALGLVLWLAVVPGLAFGWERNTELLESWYRLMVRPSLVDNRVTTEHPNQSVPGVVYRLLTHSPSFIVYPGNIPTPAAYHNLADIGTDTARWVVKGCVAGFGLLVVLLCRAPRGVRQGRAFAAECALIALGMLLFSERTWKHHAVTLVLPLAVIVSAVFAPELPRRARSALVGVLVMVGMLTVVPGMLPTRAADLAMVYGTHTAAFLLLTGAVGWLLASRNSVSPITPASRGT